MAISNQFYKIAFIMWQTFSITVWIFIYTKKQSTLNHRKKKSHNKNYFFQNLYLIFASFDWIIL